MYIRLWSNLDYGVLPPSAEKLDHSDQPKNTTETTAVR